MCDVAPCPHAGSPGLSLPSSTVQEFTFLSAGLVRLCLCQHTEGSSWRARESKAVIALCVRSGKSYIQPTSSFGNFPAKRLGLFGKHALLKQPQSEIHPCRGVKCWLWMQLGQKSLFGGRNTKRLFVCGKDLCPPEVPTDLE